MRPLTLLVISSNPLEYCAVMKNVSARERYVHKNESYILGTLKEKPQDTQLIIREPCKHTSNMASVTRQALKLFQPHFVFFLGTAQGAGRAVNGDVVISDRILSSTSTEDGEHKIPVWIGGNTGPDPLYQAEDLAQMEDALRHLNPDSTAAIHEGCLLADKTLISYVNHTPLPEVQVVATEAEGFFTALQSNPGVSGWSVLGIDEVGETVPGPMVPPGRVAENLASALHGLWRLINYRKQND